MSKKPVVVYGASGYTGRLIAEYLREYRIPFIAAGRDADRVREVMAGVPGLDPADYEVAAVEHTEDALAELFEGAAVVCNTVGPFIQYGGEVAAACLRTGCHYLDTTGEQNWVLAAEERFGADFAAKGLLLAPCIAQMFTTGEIAANICLETPGLDTLDILVLWKGLPTYASTQTIFTILNATHYHLDQKAYVAWSPTESAEMVVPGQHRTSLVTPWGGTAHPVWFKRDPRVANVRAMGGVVDRGVMQSVMQMTQMVEAQIKTLPIEEQGPALSKFAASVQAGMPPRENQRINTSIDSVHASGPAGHAHCAIHGTCNYKQTGLLQAYAAYHLIQAPPLRTGFASGCQAFGHRALLGVLQSFGLAGRPIVNGVAG
jgi:short subunit dehydrogenase-like uncharacterized protein